MKLDTFVQLIKNLQVDVNADDTDPNNVVLQMYSSPFDTLTMTETLMINAKAPSGQVWGDGSTYVAYDNNGNPYNAPSCGWAWDEGGVWN